MMSIADYVASGGQYGRPRSYAHVGYEDGMDELMGETEGFDLFKDVLAPVGNVLTAPIQAIGQVASGHADQALGTLLDPAGVFKSNGPVAGILGGATGGGPGGLLGGITSALGGPGGILGGLSQGVQQGLGLGGAPTPGGSILGAGIGGVIPGTGGLPGLLGQLATQLTGQPSLPPVGTTPVTPDLATLRNHTEQVGRAVVRRVLGITTPALNQVRALLAQRRNQVQATAEHRQLNAADAAHNEIMGALQYIASNNGRIPWKRY